MRIFLVLSLLTTAAAGTLPATAPLAPLVPVAARVLEPNAALRALLAKRALIELPAERLKRNWGGGSCMHASLRHLLHWQGAHELATRWERFSGGETFEGLSSKLTAAGVDWAAGKPGDIAFLRWACDTRHGAVIPLGERHAVSLVGLDRRSAYILDSNYPDRTQQVPLSYFLADWRSHGGNALTPLAGSPAAPIPWLVTEKK